MSDIVGGGTYKLTNKKAGNVMDLSGVDNHSVIGYPWHNGTNQKWTLEWAGNGWHFKSAETGQYLAPAGTASDGTKIIVQSTPFLWHIWPDTADPTYHRVYVPYTQQNLDLYGHGDATPGTPITLWWAWAGIHQTWKFEAV